MIYYICILYSSQSKGYLQKVLASLCKSCCSVHFYTVYVVYFKEQNFRLYLNQSATSKDKNPFDTESAREKQRFGGCSDFCLMWSVWRAKYAGHTC